MEELKKLIEAIGRAFEQFKAENDVRIKQIEAKGMADPRLVAKVEAINVDLSKMSAMKAQLEALEEDDDVQKVYANFDIPDIVIEDLG